MLTAIEKKQLARYEEMMALPAWKYIVIYGMLAWGLTVAVLVTIFNLIFFKHGWKEELVTNLIGFPIGGIFFGMYMRSFMPRQIKRLKDKSEKI